MPPSDQKLIGLERGEATWSQFKNCLQARQ